jgi:hypothetical protein
LIKKFEQHFGGEANSLGYGLDSWRITARFLWMTRDFLFFRESRPVLRPIRPAVHWVRGTFTSNTASGARRSQLYRLPRLRIRGDVPPNPPYAFNFACFYFYELGYLLKLLHTAWVEMGCAQFSCTKDIFLTRFCW